MKVGLEILVVEDHEIVSSTLAMIVERTLKSAPVVVARTFSDALKLLDSGPKFDLVILDMGIPGGESYEMISKLKKKSPSVRILIYSGNDEQVHALPFLKAGADGFLPKNSPMAEIPLAIKTVLNNKKYITPTIQQQITDRYFDNSIPEKDDKKAALSPREAEVMALMLQGKWTKEIAAELNLKLTTVSSHKSNIFEKMNVTNVVDLVKKMG